MAFSRNGYGQVEPNQLSAQKTGQIYARLPIASDVSVLQNGEFMYYDYASGTVKAAASGMVGEPMLVYNEVKLYESEKGQSYKDFAMTPVSFDKPNVYSSPYTLNGTVPRLFKTNVGDIMTTNMIAGTADVGEGTKLVPTYNSTSKTMVLTATETPADGAMVWVVCKGCGTTAWKMADGQQAVKIQRVQ